MAREADFQAKFIKWARSKGFKCYKQQMNATTRAGTPDLFMFKEGWWGWVEFKKSKNSSKRPGQQQNIDWAQENSWGKFVYPENFEETKEELEAML